MNKVVGRRVVSVPRSKAAATDFDQIGDAKLVGNAAVFLESTAAFPFGLYLELP